MIKLAWRNVWRNRSRSAITIAAVAFSVFFAIIMRSFQLGTYQNMIDEVMGNYFGYIQVHGEGFWDKQTLENSFEDSDKLRQGFSSKPGVQKVVGRIEAFSLVSSGDLTKGGLIMGIDPEHELEGLQLQDRIIDGEFLDAKSSSIVVGKDLAKYLNVRAGDTLFFIGQGYHAQSAYGKYPVRGIVNMRNPSLNKNLVIMPLADAQWMFGCEGRLTTYALKLNKGEDYHELAAAYRADSTLTKGLEVLTWEELFPDVIQGIQADNAGGLIIILVLYGIIGFVLFGTVIMMTSERMVEFGILVSIGMRRGILSGITLLENVLLSFVGGLVGMLFGYPIMYYFNKNPIRFDAEMSAAMEEYGYEPIFPTSDDLNILFTHGIIVVSIAILVSLYAVMKINKLKPVEALKP